MEFIFCYGGGRPELKKAIKSKECKNTYGSIKLLINSNVLILCVFFCVLSQSRSIINPLGMLKIEATIPACIFNPIVHYPPTLGLGKRKEKV